MAGPCRSAMAPDVGTGTPAREPIHDLGPVRASVLLLLAEGTGRALRERRPVRVPQPRGSRARPAAAGAVADEALPGAGRRRTHRAGGQHHHRVRAAAPSRPGATASGRSAAGGGGAHARPILRQLRLDPAAEGGVRRALRRGRPRPAWRGPGAAHAGDQLCLAGTAPRRWPAVGRRGGLQPRRLRRRTVPVLCRLDAPHPIRARPRARLSRTAAGPALHEAGGRRGPAVPQLLPARGAGPRLRTAGAPWPGALLHRSWVARPANVSVHIEPEGSQRMTPRRSPRSIRARSILAAALVAALPSALAEPLRLNEQEYFSRPGLDVLVFNNYYDGLFSDANHAGVELIHHGVRTATNGDVRLSPTPEQWDPVTLLAQRRDDTRTGTITTRLAYPQENFKYSIQVAPQGDGVRIQVLLDRPLPKSLQGRAGFNLEFLPSAYFGKSWTVGDGDRSGQFPLYPTGPTGRDAEGRPVRLPITSGRRLVLAPEDPQRRVTIQSNSGDLGLYDGRNQAQNGWFVVRTLL